MTKERLHILIDRYLSETLTKEEQAELYSAINQPETEAQTKELILEQLENKAFNYNPDLTNLYKRIVAETKEQPRVHRIHFLRTSFRKFAAAAAVITMIATTYFILNKEQEQAINAVATIDVKAPTTNRATVTLSNGQTVALDSAINGQLAMESTVSLVKLANGQIVYTGNANELIYNTLHNPKGSKPIDIGLSDGSHVWLNAGSSITYPVAFILNKERRVTMTGEAYFEIKHTDNNLAFIVQKESTEVKVLGTHFNVKAYDNEPNLKVTLLEGSVSVNKKTQSLLLKPNQQAVVTNSAIELNADADTDQAVAWKNGITSFHSADLATALRELERWYDITTEAKGNLKTKNFFAEAPRNAPLKDVLQSIFDDNNIAYEYDSEKRKLTILQ